MNLHSSIALMLHLALYSTILFLFVFLYERRFAQTADHFLVADRKILGLTGAMSIAASWIWAPALFVSTQVGYQWGFSGLVWFVIPNIFALILFGPFAAKVRSALPEGYSYIQFLSEKHIAFRNTQLSIQFLVQILCFALQLVAGAELLSAVSGTSYYAIISIMTLGALSYSLISGLSSSVATDAIQYLLIVVAIAVIYCGIYSSDIVAVKSAIPFNPLNSTMLMQFGLSSALALLFGIFSDHQQWQRAFSVKKESVASIFIGAGLLHGAVTLSLGTIGVLLYQAGYLPNNLQIVGGEYIHANLPTYYSVVFIWMVLCGLCSTLDSALCAFASLASTEISTNSDKILVGRRAMVLLASLGLLIALTRLPLITLWLMVGLLRLATIAPTVASVFLRDFHGKRGVSAIVIAVSLGTPLFLYGVYGADASYKTFGMMLCLFSSALITFSPQFKTIYVRKLAGVSQVGELKSKEL